MDKKHILGHYILIAMKIGVFSKCIPHFSVLKLVLLI